MFLTQLAAAGVYPEAVDYVLCTHLHVDHVGWNTQLRDGRWVPTFPNATYVISRKEWEYWETVHHATPLEHLAASVLPVVEAGLATFVTKDYALDNEVWLEPTPGHTPLITSACIWPPMASNGLGNTKPLFPRHPFRPPPPAAAARAALAAPPARSGGRPQRLAARHSAA